MHKTHETQDLLLWDREVMKCEITKNTNVPPKMPTIIGIIHKFLPAFMLDILIQTFHAQYCLLTTARKL